MTAGNILAAVTGLQIRSKQSWHTGMSLSGLGQQQCSCWYRNGSPCWVGFGSNSAYVSDSRPKKENRSEMVCALA